MLNSKYYLTDINKISFKDFSEAYFVMSEERQKKCLAYKKDEDKKLCIASDMLLRKVLSEKTKTPPQDLIFKYTENKKPYCENSKIGFNISHSGKFAAVGINENGNIGIDIELIRPVKSNIMKYFCSDSDVLFIKGNETEIPEFIENPEMLIRFFKVWTYKEAHVKCTGTGISKQLKEISFDEKSCIQEIIENYCITVIENK